MMKIGFLGAGRMAQALAKGFIAAGLTKGECIEASCAPQDIGCEEEFKSFGGKTGFENPPVVKNSKIIVLAVKPHIVPIVLKEIAPVITSDHLFMSIAMGVTINQLENALPDNTRIIRVMPNTPALVQSGATVITPGTQATEEDTELAHSLFRAVGICEEVPESLIDVVTALGGSGPAYIYMVIESLADGAVKMGMPRLLAYKIAAQTVVGAGKMVMETGMHPGELKDNVMSPGGSTAAACHFLEQHNLRAAMIGAVEKATEKCKMESAQK